MPQEKLVVLTLIMIILSSTTVYLGCKINVTERYLNPPLVFPNETPSLYYTRYFTNASRVQLFFGSWENAERFSTFVQNRSVVISSEGFRATVLMKRKDMERALELADYWDEAKLPSNGYGNPREIEQRYEDLNFLLNNYDFPAPIYRYLLRERDELEEELESINRARNFIQSHKALSFYEITVLEPSSILRKNPPDVSLGIAVLAGVEMALLVLFLVEEDKRVRALFLASILVLGIPLYELANYESSLKDHEAVKEYILRMPESEGELTSTWDINGSVGISCFVKDTTELKRILKHVNSTEVGMERSLRGSWLRLRFTSYAPGMFLRFKGCYLSTYGYKCSRSLTRQELSVINRTREIIREIPADKRYLVKGALSIYNSTLTSCDVPHNSLPPGKYLVSLMIMPDKVKRPSYSPIAGALILAVLLLLSTLLFRG